MQCLAGLVEVEFFVCRKPWKWKYLLLHVTLFYGPKQESLQSRCSWVTWPSLVSAPGAGLADGRGCVRVYGGLWRGGRREAEQLLLVQGFVSPCLRNSWGSNVKTLCSRALSLPWHCCSPSSVWRVQLQPEELVSLSAGGATWICCFGSVYVCVQ